jgi:hypothetical protein
MSALQDAKAQIIGRVDRHSWTKASTILGQDDVPMSYDDIRENQEPDYANEDNGDFEQLWIAYAPLAGFGFKTDARRVHSYWSVSCRQKLQRPGPRTASRNKMGVST